MKTINSRYMYVVMTTVWNETELASIILLLAYTCTYTFKLCLCYTCKYNFKIYVNLKKKIKEKHHKFDSLYNYECMIRGSFRYRVWSRLSWYYRADVSFLIVKCRFESWEKMLSWPTFMVRVTFIWIWNIRVVSEIEPDLVDPTSLKLAIILRKLTLE